MFLPQHQRLRWPFLLILILTCALLPAGFSFHLLETLEDIPKAGLNLTKSFLKETLWDPLFKIPLGLNITENFLNTFVGKDTRLIQQTPIRLPYRAKVKTPSIHSVAYYVHFAAAVYCTADLLDWSCPECIILGPSIDLAQVVRNKSYESKAMIAVDHGKSAIVITYRGSYNVFNVVEDFKAEMIDSPHYAIDGVRIHHGFYNILMSLYPTVLNATRHLVSKYPKYGVVFSGHSLGGTLGTLTYYLFKYDLPIKHDHSYSLYSYVAPRGGNQALADFINTRKVKVARVVRDADLPARLPPVNWGYVHHLREWWIHDNGTTRLCSKTFYEDLNCSSSIKLYRLTSKSHNTFYNTSVSSCLKHSPFAGLWEIGTG